MEKHELEKFKANTERALKWWKEEITPETVNISIWEWGTFACFGGHIERADLFKEIPGVYGETYGGIGIICSLPSATGAIFGDETGSLFSGRRFFEDAKSDHQVIVLRLERHLEQLNQQLSFMEAERGRILQGSP